MMNMGCAIKCIPYFVCVLSMSAVVGLSLTAKRGVVVCNPIK